VGRTRGSPLSHHRGGGFSGCDGAVCVAAGSLCWRESFREFVLERVFVGCRVNVFKSNPREESGEGRCGSFCIYEGGVALALHYTTFKHTLARKPQRANEGEREGEGERESGREGDGVCMRLMSATVESVTASSPLGPLYQQLAWQAFGCGRRDSGGHQGQAELR